MDITTGSARRQRRPPRRGSAIRTAGRWAAVRPSPAVARFLGSTA